VKTLLVKALPAKERFLREERGFSLPEMMITIVIMTVMFLALFSVFDMSLRVFNFGSNKVEAMESARAGLEKMEREMRAAFPAGADAHLFFGADGSTSNPPQAMPTATQITFGNELGAGGAGDGTIECGDPCEYITYKLSDPSDDPPCTLAACSTLLRVNTANSDDPGDPVSENAVVPGGLTFTYLNSADDPATTEGEIAKVRVSLTITVDPNTKYEATQKLTTEIDLRNRQ